MPEPVAVPWPQPKDPMTHGFASAARPFFLSVIFSSQGWQPPDVASHFRMFYKNFTRVNI